MSHPYCHSLCFEVFQIMRVTQQTFFSEKEKKKKLLYREQNTAVDRGHL